MSALEPRAVRVDDAAAALGVSRRHMQRLLASGEIESFTSNASTATTGRKAGGTRLVVVASIDDYVERHRSGRSAAS